MTALKITSLGNSAGVLLPKELLAKLRVEKGDMLHVIEIGHGIGLTPSDPESYAQIAVVEGIISIKRHFMIGKLMSMVCSLRCAMRDRFCLPCQCPKTLIIILNQNQT